MKRSPIPTYTTGAEIARRVAQAQAQADAVGERRYYVLDDGGIQGNRKTRRAVAAQLKGKRR